MRRRLLPAVAVLLLGLVMLFGPASASAAPVGGPARQQMGGGEDARDRPANVGGLVVGIGMVVVWGVLVAEVLRRASARRASVVVAALDAPPVRAGARAAATGGDEGDACSARPPP